MIFLLNKNYNYKQYNYSDLSDYYHDLIELYYSDFNSNDYNNNSNYYKDTDYKDNQYTTNNNYESDSYDI
jgi:hypothetical protein